MHGLGRVYMEPKGHIVLDDYPGEFEVMPSFIEDPPAAACKWVSIREDNARFELPTVFSILVYTDPETGFPLAICDGSHHTMMRTGSSAAVSAKWLARKDSKVLAIVGAGTVGRGALATCNEVFPWEEVRVWSRSRETLDRFVAEEQPLYDELRAARPPRTSRRSSRGADVVVTGTHARGGHRRRRLDLARDAHRRPRRRPGGRAGARGRRSFSRQPPIFVDDIRQCRADGEINVPLREGLISEEDVAGEIGKVIVDELAGRESDDQVTVFDSTGIALQDSATVPLEYERAVAAGVGIEKKMIAT